MSIEMNGLVFSYGERKILDGIDFRADEGEVIALLGPNGAGKSTLFKCMLGSLSPQSGEIRIGGKNIGSYDKPSLAKEIAYIPQTAEPTFGYTVLESVLMGMTNRMRLFEGPSPELFSEAQSALVSLGIAELAERPCTHISGGERQLMLLARALVQQAKVLIMDEPTANLDYGNSFRVMQKIRELSEKGYSVIFSTHEPSQAFRYAGRVIALKSGKIIADGPPADVLTEDTLEAIYNIGVAVREVSVFGKSYKLPVPHEKR